MATKKILIRRWEGIVWTATPDGALSRRQGPFEGKRAGEKYFWNDKQSQTVNIERNRN